MKKITDKRTLNSFLDYESKGYQLKSARYPIFAIKDNQILYRINYSLRKLEYYTNSHSTLPRVFWKVRYTRLKRKYGIDLPINVFDKGLKLIHLGSRLVNKNSVVGKDCTLHINTCIVAGGTNDDAPVIGDNCILGVGSIVLGRAKLGDNTAVGAGAVVNKDFSQGNITIAGVPAKIVSQNTRNDWNKKAKTKSSR